MPAKISSKRGSSPAPPYADRTADPPVPGVEQRGPPGLRSAAGGRFVVAADRGHVVGSHTPPALGHRRQARGVLVEELTHLALERRLVHRCTHASCPPGSPIGRHRPFPGLTLLSVPVRSRHGAGATPVRGMTELCNRCLPCPSPVGIVTATWDARQHAVPRSPERAARVRFSSLVGRQRRSVPEPFRHRPRLFPTTSYRGRGTRGRRGTRTVSPGVKGQGPAAGDRQGARRQGQRPDEEVRHHRPDPGVDRAPRPVSG